jgi:hypothetical protein
VEGAEAELRSAKVALIRATHIRYICTLVLYNVPTRRRVRVFVQAYAHANANTTLDGTRVCSVCALGDEPPVSAVSAVGGDRARAAVTGVSSVTARLTVTRRGGRAGRRTHPRTVTCSPHDLRHTGGRLAVGARDARRPRERRRAASDDARAVARADRTGRAGGRAGHGTAGHRPPPARRTTSGTDRARGAPRGRRESERISF